MGMPRVDVPKTDPPLREDVPVVDVPKTCPPPPPAPILPAGGPLEPAPLRDSAPPPPPPPVLAGADAGTATVPERLPLDGLTLPESDPDDPDGGAVTVPERELAALGLPPLKVPVISEANTGIAMAATSRAGMMIFISI